MNFLDCFIVLFGITGVSLVVVRVVGAFRFWKMNRSRQRISLHKCSECLRILGSEVLRSATQKRLGFETGDGCRMRGRESRSRLIIVRCPNCNTDLQVRLMGVCSAVTWWCWRKTQNLAIFLEFLGPVFRQD
jgi:hypothetical protein